jgi:hypothetical protein
VISKTDESNTMVNYIENTSLLLKILV